MKLDELNKLSPNKAFEELFKCCGSTQWASALESLRPFSNETDLINKSDECWSKSNEEDALEAFTHHPKIGDVKSLEKKFASTKDWAGGEQSGVNVASKKILEDLAQGNTDYENKFGYIFIVCATGKSAEEMLQILQQRLPNDKMTELEIAKGEQNKITHIRLKKLING